MNKGISLQELAAKLEKIEAGKKDLVVPTTKMAMEGGDTLIIGNGEQTKYKLNPLAHEQISARLEIPRQYYRRMQENEPELLDKNVNTWLHKARERRLVRIYDGNVRAFLSDRYKPKENFTAAMELFPILHQAGNIQIMSSELTEKHMFIKAISHDLEGEVRVGQIVKGGISIRNSEVGCGAFDLSLFVLTLACMNGMIRENSMRSYHIGRRLDAEEDEVGIGILSQEAIAADSEAFRLKIRDVMRYAFDKKKFDEELYKFRLAANNPLNTRQITDTIEDVTKRFSLTQGEGKDVLSRLIQSGDMTQWGLSSAVTNLAGDVDDYERSTELEKIGGQIIELKSSDWRSIARLAA